MITIDAMRCQKKTVAEIMADYVLSLKGNHATVHDEFSDYFKVLEQEKATSLFLRPI